MGALKNESKWVYKKIERLNNLKEYLLGFSSPDEKLKCITDGVVEIFNADFARIWITKLGDNCETGCIHARIKEGLHACRYQDSCLHLVSSSGRYTHIDGEVHKRVPFGCYKIGRVAAGDDPKFVTNNVTHDPLVHNKDWARELGLVSFAGYRLLSKEGTPIGVLALFCKHAISNDEDHLLATVANTTAQVIQTVRAEEELTKYRSNLEDLVEKRTSELVKLNEQLRKEITKRDGAEETLQKKAHELSERVKELNCLYGISELIDKPGISLKGILQGVVNLIPSAWQYLEITCVRIMFEDQVYKTINFQETPWRQACEIMVHDNRMGILEIFYLEEKPEINEGPFLREERSLLNAIAERLGKIIEHRWADEKLLLSENNYRTLLENLPQRIFHKDRNSVYVSCNGNYARDLKIKPDEIAGMTDYDFYSKELAEKYRVDDKKVMELDKTIDVVEKYIYDGREEIVQTVKTPIKDERGNIVGVLGIFWDITEHRMYEEELQKFKAIADCSNYGVVMSDIKGNLTYINEAFAQMHGYNADELIGKNLSIFHSEEQMKHVSKLNKQLIQTGGFVSEEIWHKRKDDTVFPTLMSAITIKDENNKPRFLSSTAIDITDHKQAEKKLISYKNQLKSLAAQLISTEERERKGFAKYLHDQIGQALFVLKIKLELLQKSLPPNDTAISLDEVLELTNQIIKDTRSLTTDLSPAILYHFDLEAGLEWLVERFDKQHEIMFDFEDDKQPKPLDINTHIVLFQSVRELLFNAVKHAQAQNVKVSVLRNGEDILVRVEDDGVGFIPSEIVPSRDKDVGFGLFSIKERVDHFDGHLEIESKPNCGSQITILAPLNIKNESDGGDIP